MAMHSAFALDQDTTLIFLPPNDQGALRKVQYLVLDMLYRGDLVQFENFSMHKWPLDGLGQVSLGLTQLGMCQIGYGSEMGYASYYTYRSLMGWVNSLWSVIFFPM